MIGRRSHDDAQSFEEAWNGRTPRDEHIAGLVQFAEDLCKVAVAEPSTQFRTDLRAQLMAEAATVLMPLPAAAPHREPATVTGARTRRRRVAGLTAALIASAGSVTLVASSASALPGEMLYPVKRGMENVELTLHRDDASRGEFQLARASERLAEAGTLASGDAEDQRQISGLLDDFTQTAGDAWESMDDAFDQDASVTTMESVNVFAQSAAQDLTALRAALPADAAPAFSDATDVIITMTSNASERCTTCSEVDLGQLVSAVTDLTRSIPLLPADPAPKPDKDSGSISTPATTPTRPAGSGATTRTPTKTPAQTPTSTPALPLKTPSLSDITDPLLGALLGDEDEVGLVPGLLGGLLGTSK